MANANGRACKALLCASVAVATMIGRPARVHAQNAVLYSCTDITQPGVYWLGSSLAAASGQPCMQVHSQGPVTLDCRHFGIQTAFPAHQPLLIENSQNFTIQNCNIGPTASYGGPDVQIQNSSNGTLQSNFFARSPVAAEVDTLAVVSSDSITFTNNTFAVPYSQTYTTNSHFDNNSLSCWPTTCAGMIESKLGRGNSFTNNTIDGRTSTDQWSTSTGADDGIIVGDETGDNFSGNTISNTYDCGIEVVGNVSYSTFNNNTIINTTNCGIGGWYWMSFHGNIVHGNTVNGSANLFTFLRRFGLRSSNWDGHGIAADTGVYFTGNTFDGNSITNVYAASADPLASGYSVYIPIERPGPQYLDFNESSVKSSETVPAASQFYLTSNSFSNNNFGPPVAFFGEPNYPGAVGDQGGNVCVQQSYSDYPLACGRPPCGTQANPWNALGGLLAAPAHLGQWGQMTVNGTCEMGTYSRRVQILGQTVYRWVQQRGVACSPAANVCSAPT